MRSLPRGSASPGRVPPPGEPRERGANGIFPGETFRLLPGFAFPALSPAAPAVPPYLGRVPPPGEPSERIANESSGVGRSGFFRALRSQLFRQRPRRCRPTWVGFHRRGNRVKGWSTVRSKGDVPAFLEPRVVPSFARRPRRCRPTSFRNHESYESHESLIPDDFDSPYLKSAFKDAHNPLIFRVFCVFRG